MPILSPSAHCADIAGLPITQLSAGCFTPHSSLAACPLFGRNVFIAAMKRRVEIANERSVDILHGRLDSEVGQA